MIDIFVEKKDHVQFYFLATRPDMFFSFLRKLNCYLFVTKNKFSQFCASGFPYIAFLSMLKTFSLIFSEHKMAADDNNAQAAAALILSEIIANIFATAEQEKG